MKPDQLIKTVLLAQSGDRDALEKLYLDTYKSVYYLALRNLKNSDDAEDITQEVFITLNDKISTLREPAAFYKWLNQLTSNKCTDFLRRRRGYMELDDDVLSEIMEDDSLNLPDKAIDDEETRRIILEVIDALPDKQRVCIMFYYYQQHTITEIAEILGTNENTVKTRLSLARAKIRAALEYKAEKEGIKLWGIPLALTPILRQAMEEFVMPAGLGERMWENIARSTGIPADTGHGGNQSRESAQPERTHVTCPSCGKQLPAGLVMCFHCGNSMETSAEPIPPESQVEQSVTHEPDMKPEGTICSKCQSALPPGLKVCFRCGQSLQESAVAEPVAHKPEPVTPEATAPTSGAIESVAVSSDAAIKTAAATGGILAGSKGIIVGVIAAAVLLGGAVGGHFMGLYSLPLLPAISQTDGPSSPGTIGEPGTTQPGATETPGTTEPGATDPAGNNGGTNDPTLSQRLDIPATQIHGTPVMFQIVHQDRDIYMFEAQTPEQFIGLKYYISHYSPGDGDYLQHAYFDNEYTGIAGATVSRSFHSEHGDDTWQNAWYLLVRFEGTGDDGIIIIQLGDDTPGNSTGSSDGNAPSTNTSNSNADDHGFLRTHFIYKVESNVLINIDGVTIYFDPNNAPDLSLSDLSDFRLYKDGQEIPVSLSGSFHRDHYDQPEPAIVFTFGFSPALTEPGAYTMTFSLFGKTREVLYGNSIGETTPNQ